MKTYFNLIKEAQYRSDLQRPVKKQPKSLDTPFHLEEDSEEDQEWINKNRSRGRMTPLEQELDEPFQIGDSPQSAVPSRSFQENADMIKQEFIQKLKRDPHVWVPSSLLSDPDIIKAKNSGGFA